MFDKVKEIIQKYTENEVKETSMLVEDLGLTSFDLVAIVSDFEDEFSIEVPDRDVLSFTSISDIVAYLEEKTK